MATYYIGADVHSNNTELAVEQNGQIVLRRSVATTVEALRGVLDGLEGRKHLTLEEGPLSGWLYRGLVAHVDSLTVCDPRRNKLIASDGDKDDRIDAAKLAALLRGGFLRPVHHSRDEAMVRLKQWVALYHDRVREATRSINKIRACCRQHGRRVPGRALRDLEVRQTWLMDLEDTDLAAQVQVLFTGYDATAEQERRIKRQLSLQSRRFEIVGHWSELPGMGLIRSMTLLAYLDTPWRFKKKSRLWKYCGVGLQRAASGQDRHGREHPAQLELVWPTNTHLKNVIVGATLSAIRGRDNGFRRYYERMLAHGTLVSNARHATARKLLTVLWGMWKTNRRFDDGLCWSSQA